LTVAEIVNATAVIIGGNEDHERAYGRIRAAVDVVSDELSFPQSLQVVPVGSEYRLTEETMTIEAVEGADRVEARRRPPTPEIHGINGRPTVIHTPRTLAQIRSALGDSDYLEASDADPGTRLFSLVEDGCHLAVVELPTTQSLQAVLNAVGVEVRSEFKMVCVGGQFGGLTRSLDVLANAPALRAAGLGTNGVIELLSDSQCAVAFAGRRAKFAREENCGRCVPCREGSKQLVSLLREVYGGEYDSEKLRELARTIRDTSLCSFGVEAARPVLTALDEFEAEFIAHAGGTCPAGECSNL